MVLYLKGDLFREEDRVYRRVPYHRRSELRSLLVGRLWAIWPL